MRLAECLREWRQAARLLRLSLGSWPEAHEAWLQLADFRQGRQRAAPRPRE